jgi:transketolase
MLERAYNTFLNTNDRPTMIIVQSHIGYGAPHKQDTASAHGEPLGPEEVRLAKEFYGLDPDAEFYVPEGVQKSFQDQIGSRGALARESWNELFSNYRRQYPDLADAMDRMHRGEMPADWQSALPVFPANETGIATRDSSATVLNALAAKIPWLLGGAADLAPSTKTHLKFEFAGEFQAIGNGDYRGRNFHFGVREHAMCAIANGMALSGLRPFAASFFIFTDYCRAAVRLSALMELPIIYIWTHDSVSLGEDGPTHQPIEHLASLRAMPGMIVIRPADANEVAEAWRVILQLKDRPVSLVLTRQALPTLDRAKSAPANGVSKGAYVLIDTPDAKPDVLLLASGSEVSLCVAAQEQLALEGIHARVVSMPSWELFENQSVEYRNSVLPPEVTARVSVEEASTFGWERYAGTQGTMIGIDTFGLSAPIKVVQRHFGFTPEHVVNAARKQVTRQGA